MYRPRTVPMSPGYRSAACRYAADGPYRQCACLLTVTVGKANVAVAVAVNVEAIVGVKVIVGVDVRVGVSVSVGVNVKVGVDVFVHDAAVAVMDVAVNVACCSGDGAQAVANNTSSKIILKFISSLLKRLRCWFPALHWHIHL